jgi:penicillin-binding protein 1A
MSKGKLTVEHKLEKEIKKKKRKKIRRIIFSFLSLCLITVTAIIIAKFYPEYKNIKQNAYEKLSNMTEDSFKRAGNTEIYDKDGNIIGKYGNEKYEYISFQDISKYIVNGYIAKEDRNFLNHHGVDYKAILRAGYSYIKHKGVITQGGSTITQQVIKNNLLTSEQTYQRKITEIMLARALEKQYNKNQIMEFYCNSNYFGNGCYGVQAASQYYFGCDAKDISLGNAAILVATSNLPNVYNPIVNYDLSLEKRNDVLDDMLTCQYISQEEYDEAVAEKPTIVKQQSSEIKETYLTTYALHCTALKIMKKEGFDFKYTYRTEQEYEEYKKDYDEKYNNTVEVVRSGGYKIYTSLNQNIQKKLQQSIDSNLSEFQERNENDEMYALQSAGVCVDNNSNMVVAIVGGRNNEGYYNRGYQAKRQSGSAIKPLLDYAPAINEGVVSCGTMVKDEEISIDGYSPLNANRKYIGDVSVRSALFNSINTIAVKLYTETGKETALSYLADMHFHSMSYADMIAPSIAIGGFTNGVAVDEMAKGYSTLANGGKYSENTCIYKIIDSNNEIIYQSDDATTEVFNEDTAFMMTDMMQQTFKENGGAGNKYQTDKQIYVGKTGTTNDTKDVWFCGYSAYYTTAIWIGYDTPREMENMQSATYPTKIWIDFMQDLHKNLAPKEFMIPNTVKLMNNQGDIKDIDYNKDVYESRPYGYDYISMISYEKVQQRKKEEENKIILEEAKTAVEEFEQFQITSIEKAQSFADLYNETYEKVSKVSDDSEKESLMKRISYKYDLLSGEVVDKWNEAIDSYNQVAQEQRNSENILKKQESIEAAEQNRKEQYINLVKWYIEKLNERTYYTDYIKELVLGADEALSNCVGFDEYEELKQELDTAENYVMSLSKPEITQ